MTLSRLAVEAGSRRERRREKADGLRTEPDQRTREAHEAQQSEEEQKQKKNEAAEHAAHAEQEERDVLALADQVEDLYLRILQRAGWNGIPGVEVITEIHDDAIAAMRAALKREVDAWPHARSPAVMDEADYLLTCDYTPVGWICAHG